MITPQRIVDILETRYAELTEERDAITHRNGDPIVTGKLLDDNISRLNELEIVFLRINGTDG